jgi:hypothetical protein
MAATYSLSNTGCSAQNAQQPLVIDVPDQVSQTAGSEQLTMQNGTAFLAKLPDGSQAWHVFDTERSIPGVYRVLRRLY